MNTVALITSSEGACFQKFDFLDLYEELIENLWMLERTRNYSGWMLHISKIDGYWMALTPLVSFHSILIPRRIIINKLSYWWRWDALNKKFEQYYLNREVYNGLEWHEHSCGRDRS